MPWLRETVLRIVQRGLAPDDGNPIGSSAFGALARELAPGILEKLVDGARRGPAPTLAAEPRGICLAGFSAAHGLINPLCAEPSSLAQLSVLGAFDAYYGRDIKRGFAAACARAVKREMLVIATASDSPDPRVGSCHQGWQKLLQTLPLEPFDLRQLEPLDLAPRLLDGADAWHAGGFLYLHAPASTHGEHASAFAPALLSRLAVPYLAGLRTQLEHAPEGSVVGLAAILWGASLVLS